MRTTTLLREYLVTLVLLLHTDHRGHPTLHRPVRERGDDQPVGVAEVLEPVVQTRVNHLQLHRLIHPVVSEICRDKHDSTIPALTSSDWPIRGQYFGEVTTQEPVLPHLTGPGELRHAGHTVLDQLLQNVPRMNIHCQQRPQSLPANIVLSHYINDLDSGIMPSNVNQAIWCEYY